MKTVLLILQKQQVVQQQDQRLFPAFPKVRGVKLNQMFSCRTPEPEIFSQSQPFFTEKVGTTKQTNFLSVLSPVQTPGSLLVKSYKAPGSDVNGLPGLHHLLLLQSFLFGLFAGVHHLTAEGLGAAGRRLLFS